MKTEPNQLAYPCDGEYAGEARSNNDAGLTKREHMAIEFTKALLGRGEHGYSDSQGNAQLAIQQADELIKQLNAE